MTDIRLKEYILKKQVKKREEYDPEKVYPSLKVLIIDDHDPIRKAMRRILLGMGILEVLECSDGESSLKQLDKMPDIDLILCDIYMRRKSGFDVLKSVRSRNIRSDVPLIIITGEASKDDIVKASALGADDYIIKPFQAESLSSKVAHVLKLFFDPTPIMSKLREADRAYLAHQYDHAEMAYKSAIKLDKDNKRARHSYALTLFHSGKKKQGIAAFEENIKIHPSYYKNYATLANIYLKVKDYSKCISFLEQEVEQNARQPDRQALLGKLLLKRADLEGATHHFREALKEEMRHKEALLGIGHAFAQSDDLSKAIYYFKRMRRYYPKENKSLLAIVQICNRANEPKKAELTIYEEYKNHPDRYDTFIILAKLYLGTNQIDKAKQVIKRLLLNDPENPDGIKLRAAVSMKLSELEPALKDLQTLNKTRPDLESLLAESDCLVKMGRSQQALSIIHKVLAKKPNTPSALYLAGCAFASSKLAGQAYFAFRLALSTGDKSSRVKQKIETTGQFIQNRRLSKQAITS